MHQWKNLTDRNGKPATVKDIFVTERARALLFYWHVFRREDIPRREPRIPPVFAALDFASEMLGRRKYLQRDNDNPRDYLLNERPDKWSMYPEIHWAIIDGLFEAAAQGVTRRTKYPGFKLDEPPVPVRNLMRVFGWPTWRPTGNASTNAFGYTLANGPTQQVDWWRITRRWEDPRRDVPERTGFVAQEAPIRDSHSENKLRGTGLYAALHGQHNFRAVRPSPTG
jgi:hypothetical protein